MITIPHHILSRTDVNSTGKLLLAAVLAYPNLTSGQLAVKLFACRRNTYSLCKQLSSKGILTRTKKGIHTYYTITPVASTPEIP